jgi:hypothetical protein
MKIIPIIHLKKRKIIEPEHAMTHSIIKILERFKNKKLYILDHDGLEKNKPNLCLYQKLSKYHEIWVDAGPQVLGDVVDSVIAGATDLTIRKNLWGDINFSVIKDITENKIFAEVNLYNYNLPRITSSFVYTVDGLVVFDKKNQIESDFKYAEYLKSICTRYETYAYEIEKTNALYWKKLGVTGLLTELENIEVFENIEF